jgi:hypothetical protein
VSPQSGGSRLIGIIEAADAATRDRSLDAVCREATLPELLVECEALDRFRRRSDNLYQRVRALFFLYAIHRFHVPRRETAGGRSLIPYSGYAHLLKRRFEEAIDTFLAAQQADGGFVRCVDGEMESAQALDSDDPSRLEPFRCVGNRILARQEIAAVVQKLKLWAADPAGVGLGMEAAVQRVVIFLPTQGAHRKNAHRGMHTVVGDFLHDRETGATIRAIDEGVPVAAVRRIQQLAQAVVSRSDLGRDQRALSVRTGLSRNAPTLDTPGNRRNRSEPGDSLSGRPAGG